MDYRQQLIPINFRLNHPQQHDHDICSMTTRIFNSTMILESINRPSRLLLATLFLMPETPFNLLQALTRADTLRHILVVIQLISVLVSLGISWTTTKICPKVSALALTHWLCVPRAALFADRPRDPPLVDEALLQLVVVEERVQVEHGVRRDVFRLCIW